MADMNNGKLNGHQNRPAALHGSILSCLGSTIVQVLRSFRCICVDFATKYKVYIHYGKRQGEDICCACFVWKNRGSGQRKTRGDETAHSHILHFAMFYSARARGIPPLPRNADT